MSGEYSGAENVAISIINGTSDQACGTYLSPDGPINDILKKNKIEHCAVDKVSITSIRKRVAEIKPNIIHAHDFTASVMAAFSDCGVPVISHLHSNPPWLKTRNIRTITYKQAAKRVQKILAVSDAVMGDYFYGDKLKNKVEVIGNPINIESIRKKAQTGKALSAYDVLFIGRLTAPKDPVKFIEIIAECRNTLPKIKAAMIGAGELAQEVRTVIDQRCLEENIELLGFLDNPYSILENSKALCMPSKWEGFGLAAVEALSLGVPVVCSGAGGLKDIVNDNCGKICTDDTGDYAREILKLCMDDDYRRSVSDCAIRRADELNNTSEYMNRIKKLYEELAGQSLRIYEN